MDKTGICNQALGHLASSAELSNVDLDRTKEAQACRLYYETARDAVLRAFPWPFARRIVAPALVSDWTADDESEWDYAYRYPADALALRRLANEFRQRNDVRSSRVPYQIMGDDTGRLIVTDEVDARLEYTAKIEDPELFDSDFVIALSLYLASLLAPRITSGDQFQLGERAAKKYEFAIRRAQMASLREEQDDDLPDSEMILVRE